MNTTQPFGVPAPDAKTIVPMGIGVYPRQTSWSYSSVDQHNKCPAVIRFRKIDRLPEPRGDALNRGIVAHEQVASFLTRKEDVRLHYEFDPRWTERLRDLRDSSNHLLVEHQVAFNRKWKEVEWTDPSAWLRVIFDTLAIDASSCTAVIYEYKTGKRYPGHDVQVRLYALAALLLAETDVTVWTRLVYLDDYPTVIDSQSYKLADLPALKAEFTDFSKDYLNDTIYPAKPNRFCQYCHFRKTNGGPCQFA